MLTAVPCLIACCSVCCHGSPRFVADIAHFLCLIQGDSTSGTEDSHERSRGDINMTRGYELWFAQQALARNPDIVRREARPTPRTHTFPCLPSFSVWARRPTSKTPMMVPLVGIMYQCLLGPLCMFIYIPPAYIHKK